jgi:hypothetical protein
MPRHHGIALAALVAITLAMTGCPNGTPENTIAFTLDDVNYVYAASTGPSTEGWGRGESWGSGDPFGSDADYSIDVIIYDEEGVPLSFYTIELLTRPELETAIVNIDAVGEQMQGIFTGPYTDSDSGTHTLENLVFSVERLADVSPAN